MQVTYTGLHHNLDPKVQAKLDAKFSKLSKLLDGRGEHKAHVTVSHQKRAFRAEVTVPFYGREFVGLGSDADLFKALSMALEKLDAQAVKQRARWRETHRRQPKPETPTVAPAHAAAAAKKVFRVNMGRRKPITLEEAVLVMDDRSNHLVFRDAETDRLSVLVRRGDGHLDLIEC
jgi:putative sigma-54 modulation protein